jgi:DNA-binding transcriptional MerR regulator
MHIELQPDKRYYSIGEIAKAFDVNASLIRFGTVNLTFLSQRKTLGNRMFTLKIKNLQLIYHLVKRGFTLEGAKIHLKEGKEDIG